MIRLSLAILVLLGARAPAQEYGPFPDEGVAAALIDPVEATLNPMQMLDAAGRTVSADETRGLSAAINIMVLLTVITLVPSIMLMTTCFVRIIIVLGLLRQRDRYAVASTNAGGHCRLALFMTIHGDVADAGSHLQRGGHVLTNSGEITDYDTLWDRAAKQPLRDFMFAQIEATGNWNERVHDPGASRGMTHREPENLATMTRQDVPTTALIPAYMLSELKTAFLMGFRVYLPFLVIDIDDREPADLDEHDDAPAGAHQSAVQAAALRSGGRLAAHRGEPSGRASRCRDGPATPMLMASGGAA